MHGSWHQYDIHQLLKHSRYRQFLELDQSGVQLPSLIAVAEGLKPAMDLWVSASRLSAIARTVHEFNLSFFVDVLFDRYDERTLQKFPASSFNTTRAVLASAVTDRCEAHVFLAREGAALASVIASGWYPLVIGSKIVPKPFPDHAWFGDALGYPKCCQQFFRDRNDWRHDNTYYAAYLNTLGAPLALCNSLPRHTAFYLAPHMPCSFACEATREYSENLQAVIRADSPAYATVILHRLAAPALCLSENRMFSFDGFLETPGEIRYKAVLPLSPTTRADPLFEMLGMGNRVLIDHCVLRVLRNHDVVGTYFARTDLHGPEAPFCIQCV